MTPVLSVAERVVIDTVREVEVGGMVKEEMEGAVESEGGETVATAILAPTCHIPF